MDVPALELRGIGKRYPSRERAVLDGIDLVVPRGACVHVGGLNGAGKTTMLRIITGVIAPDRGSVRILGLDPAVDRQKCQRAIGFLAAGNSGLYARLTVMQHLEVWGRLAFVPRTAHRACLAQALESFDLEALVDQRCDRLSMGSGNRLRLAIAMIGAPDLVLLDEPLTSLDLRGRDLLVLVIEDLLQRGGSVMWCSPDAADLPFDDATTYRLDSGRLRLVPSGLVTSSR